MLNYNVNYIEPFQKNRNFLKGGVNFTFKRSTIVAAGNFYTGALAPIVYGTGSIRYIPYNPDTVYFSGSLDTGSLYQGTAIGQAVTITVSGSGEWPTTGSNEFYILIGSSLGYYQTASLLLSDALGNMNLSGSKISASFLPEKNNEYNIGFGIQHTKGNIYSPEVYYLLQNLTSESNSFPINGYSASFNVVKNTNESLYSFDNVTGSNTFNFAYEYNFGVTSSFTASINNVTGSTTMSFSIPDTGLNEVFQFYNPTTTIAEVTASFVATKDTPYEVTASIEFNKGNISNSDMNWRFIPTSTTQDLEGVGANLNGPSSSFQLKKDIAVMVDYPEVTSSLSGSYKNNYSFNQTASITQNVNNTTGSVTMSIEIPEAGIDVEQRWFNPTTAQAKLTASFEAYGQNPFSITSSVINNKGNEANSDINYLVTSSNGQFKTKTNATASLNILKDVSYNPQFTLQQANLFTSSVSGSFPNAWAFNQSASYTSSWRESYSADSSSRYWAVSWMKNVDTGYYSWSYDTSSILTNDFAATTDSSSYNITASTDFYSTKIVDVVLIGGGGAGGSIEAGGGGGAGALVTGSFRLLANFGYQINIGAGGNPYANGSGSLPENGYSSSFIGRVSPYPNLDPAPKTIEFIIAPGGGAGGGVNAPIQSYAKSGSNGGSGGGGNGTGNQSPTFPIMPVTFGAGGNPLSSSLINEQTQTLELLSPNQTGFRGGDGEKAGNASFPGYFYGVGGSGGGARGAGRTAYQQHGQGGDGIIINWITINPTGSRAGIAGGGGFGINSPGGAQGATVRPTTGSNGGGHGYGSAQGQPVGGWPIGSNNAIQYTGAGGGGCSDGVGAGFGASGSLSLRYLTAGVGEGYGVGGVVTTSGSYTIHTFTGSGVFTWIES